MAQVEPLPPAEVKKTHSSRELREINHHTVLAGLEVATSWVPFKKQFTYTYYNNADWAFELEHSFGSVGLGLASVDLAELEEKRTTLIIHRYVGNSFHWDFGPYHHDTRARAGRNVRKEMVETEVASFGVKGFGVAFGLGNRWQWDNGFTLGIDWLRLNIPLVVTENDNKIVKYISDEGESDDVKTVIKYFSRVPTFSLLGIRLGYSF